MDATRVTPADIEFIIEATRIFKEKPKTTEASPSSNNALAVRSFPPSSFRHVDFVNHVSSSSDHNDDARNDSHRLALPVYLPSRVELAAHQKLCVHLKLKISTPVGRGQTLRLLRNGTPFVFVEDHLYFDEKQLDRPKMVAGAELDRDLCLEENTVIGTAGRENQISDPPQTERFTISNVSMESVDDLDEEIAKVQIQVDAEDIGTSDECSTSVRKRKVERKDVSSTPHLRCTFSITNDNSRRVWEIR